LKIVKLYTNTTLYRRFFGILDQSAGFYRQQHLFCRTLAPNVNSCAPVQKTPICKGTVWANGSNLQISLTNQNMPQFLKYVKKKFTICQTTPSVPPMLPSLAALANISTKYFPSRSVKPAREIKSHKKRYRSSLPGYL